MYPRPPMKAVKSAITILERFLGDEPRRLPRDLMKRVEKCLARLSSSSSAPAEANSAVRITPEVVSSRETSPTEVAYPHGALAQGSVIANQNSRRPASDPEEDKLHKKPNTSLTDAEIEVLFQALKTREPEIKKLVGSDGIVQISGSQARCDPRQQDIDRFLGSRLKPFERVRGLLGVRSAYRDHSERKEKGQKVIKRLLSSHLKIPEETLKVTNGYAAKSEEFVEQFGSPGILWFLALTLCTWRYLARASVSKLVERIKGDNDMSTLAVSYATKWLICEGKYEKAIRHRITTDEVLFRLPEKTIQILVAGSLDAHNDEDGSREAALSESDSQETEHEDALQETEHEDDSQAGTEDESCSEVITSEGSEGPCNSNEEDEHILTSEICVTTFSGISGASAPGGGAVGNGRLPQETFQHIPNWCPGPADAGRVHTLQRTVPTEEQRGTQERAIHDSTGQMVEGSAVQVGTEFSHDNFHEPSLPRYGDAFAPSWRMLDIPQYGNGDAFAPSSSVLNTPRYGSGDAFAPFSSTLNTPRYGGGDTYVPSWPIISQSDARDASADNNAACTTQYTLTVPYYNINNTFVNTNVEPPERTYTNVGNLAYNGT